MNKEQQRKINRALWAAWFDSIWRLKWVIAGGTALVVFLAIFAADEPQTSAAEKLTLVNQSIAQGDEGSFVVWELRTSDNRTVQTRALEAHPFVEGAKYCAAVRETLVSERLRVQPGTLKPCEDRE
ncbi:MAG: hypothetical protein KTR21_03875 [Rhodobacteraceae bacterium]|nr:hypothetical protein [Paracoccaceae bacterium]